MIKQASTIIRVFVKMVNGGQAIQSPGSLTYLI